MQLYIPVRFSAGEVELFSDTLNLSVFTCDAEICICYYDLFIIYLFTTQTKIITITTRLLLTLLLLHYTPPR